MPNNQNEPAKDNLSVNALRAIIGVFGTLFLCLVAVQNRDVTPLYFILAIPIVMKCIDEESIKKIDDRDEWEGI
ncbi:hypothetical protein CJD36_020010 [Flavipsychrobacter stenotrophus]|uniref:Uncharacterized protein n=1 Tax=Flavipsychrobacter stenotrophus TaxID=2077091 RepID=A0A2S7SSE5_9BACT|nr:hypothetical protein [Flavipsychrobacter stenotrophus]PQJ09525.1 hypothetical protein CJD36_020010 [Flavipsychrobacter stenotrophus]